MPEPPYLAPLNSDEPFCSVTPVMGRLTLSWNVSPAGLPLDGTGPGGKGASAKGKVYSAEVL